MSECDLNTLLQEASTQNSLVEAADQLKKCKRILREQDGPLQISENTLAHLKSLYDKFSFQIIIPLAKFYKFLLPKIPKSQDSLLVSFCSAIYLLAQNLHGTDIGYVLKQMIRQESEILLSSMSIQRDQQMVLNQILQEKKLASEESIIEAIVEEIKDNNPFGINRLMDYFCSMSSVRDQYSVFSGFVQPIINALEENLTSNEGIDREILMKLMSFIEHFVFRYNFSIQVNKYDTSSPKFAQPYTILEINLLKIYQEMLEPLLALISVVKTADILITQGLVNVLHRLWNMFSDQRPTLYEIIFAILKETAAGGTEEARISAGQFLLVIMDSKDTSSEFKNRLESEEILSILFHTEIITEEIFELGEPSDIDTLQITIGFPLCSVIQSGGEWNHLIEVPEAKCVLSWGFATEQYDVSFTLTRVDLPEPEIIVSQYKVRCDDTPSVGIRILNSSGLYKFTWSNSYSWFRAKHLRYKVFLLRPYKKSSAIPSKDMSKTINIVHEDDIGDNCFIEDLEYLEIGVQVKKDIIRLAAMDPVSSTPNYILEEVHCHTANDVVMSISEFIKDIAKSSEVKFSSIKVGIVQEIPEYIQGIEELGSVAVSRDVHAVGLLSQDSLQAHTVIAVISEDGIRSCIVHRGKILQAEDGTTLGDLSTLKDVELAQGIGILLCMFGPAAVVLTGEDLPMDLQTFIGKIRGYVPPKIWNSSTIRESIFKKAAPVQAAAKLHYLHFKYKFTN